MDTSSQTQLAYLSCRTMWGKTNTRSSLATSCFIPSDGFSQRICMRALRWVCLSGSEHEERGRAFVFCKHNYCCKEGQGPVDKKNILRPRTAPCDLMTMYQPPHCQCTQKQSKKKKKIRWNLPWNNLSGTAANKHSYCQKLRAPKCRVYSVEVKTCHWIWFIFILQKYFSSTK